MLTLPIHAVVLDSTAVLFQTSELFNGLRVDKHLAYKLHEQNGEPLRLVLAEDELLLLTFRAGQQRWLNYTEVMRLHIATEIWATDTVPDLQQVELFKVSLQGGVNGLAALQALEAAYCPVVGLYACQDVNSLHLMSLPAGMPVAKHGAATLLLLHDSAMHTADTWLDLWIPRQGYSPSAYLQRLWQSYGDAVMAFEYHSLSVDPVTSLLLLVQQLPKGARLDLLAYGGGGILAELLAQATDQTFTEPALQRLRDLGSGALAAQLQRLSTVVAEREIKVNRCVAIASPLRGLLVAQWSWTASLSLLNTLLQLKQQPHLQRQIDYHQAWLLTAHAAGVEPDACAGWQAYRPDSALMRFLNRPQVVLRSQQIILAGDLEGRVALQPWLEQWFASDFMQDDQDLWVNTHSMQGGAVHADGSYYFLSCHRGSHHLHYLRDAACLERLVSALNGIELDRQWRWIAPDLPTPTASTSQDNVNRGIEPDESPSMAGAGVPNVAVNRDKGVIIVIPDFMGSSVQVDGKALWLEQEALQWGDFGILTATRNGVTVTGLLDEDYRPFFAHLAHQHEVVPFAYDWRKAPEELAPILAEFVKATLVARHAANLNYPLRILTQGFGGLIALRLVYEQPLLWQRLCDDGDVRLVLCGTPLQGMAAAEQLVRGEHRLIAMLDLLEGRDDASKTLAAQFAAFASIQALLPNADRTWLQALTWDAERMLYVRGEAGLTPVQPDSEAGGWLGTSQGDGVVSWASAPSAIPQWHVPLEHGLVWSAQRYFAALTELIDHGHTAYLQRVMGAPPLSNSLPIPHLGANLFPSMQEVRAAALGYHTRQTHAETMPPVELLITHGNLEHSRRVLVLGHYAGEAIVNAEAALDQRLQGRLSELYRLGIYPAALGSSEVLLNAANKQPAGAIVVGLGEVGRLSANDLATTYAQGVLRYAMLQQDALKQAALAIVPEGSYLPFELSTLLVGTFINGLTLKESLTAMLRAVSRVNSALKKLAGEDKAFLRLQSLEVVELYEDKAIEAARHIQNLLQHAEFRDEFTLNSWVRQGAGGYSRVMYNEPPGWWQRLQVTGSDKGLAFLALTDRARAESTLQATQRRLVDQFVSRAIANQQSGDCEVGKVLFEMLLPNALKDQTLSTDSLVLVLNSDAAAYPWELLYNRRDAELLPLSVRTGLVRQLQTQRFRETVLNPTERSALVIGDPMLTQLQRLPAARAEAEEVATVLQQYDFNPLVQVIGGRAEEVLCALHADDYRVLHLAGHGVYRYDIGNGVLVTGMVIGDGEFLTAVEIEQMRKVPELVFINCCHLGHLDQERATETDSLEQALNADRHQFAASFAEALIGMGVRAAIVAGWAIDDRAAQVFANTCYRALLSGENFGDAVLRARRDTWQRYPEVNTWGAYQCYGDPEYHLLQRQEDESGKQDDLTAPQFMATVEVLTELGNLINAADSASVDEYDGLLKRLSVVHEVIPAEWLRDAAVQERLGCAYGKLDQFNAAIVAYKRCLQAEYADFPFAMLEDLVSIETAYALSIHLNPTVTERSNELWADNVRDLMQEALQMLDWLDQLGVIVPPLQGVSSEIVCGKSLPRLELRGEYWKRQSMMLGAEQCAGALLTMEAVYAEALQFATDYLRCLVPSPALNWLMVRLVRVARKELVLSEADQAQMRDVLERTESQVQINERVEASFASAIGLAEAALVRYLLQVVLGQTVDASWLGQVEVYYHTALERGAPPRKVRLMVEQGQFLQLVWLPNGMGSFEAWQGLVGRLGGRSLSMICL